MNARRRNLMWALVLDIGGMFCILSFLDVPDKGWGAWAMIGITALLSVAVPLVALLWTYRKSGEESARGFNVGDRVLVDGERGVLTGHPLVYASSWVSNVGTDLDTWIVEFDDGSTRDDVHDNDLKRPGAITVLGDLVRLVRA